MGMHVMHRQADRQAEVLVTLIILAYYVVIL